MAMAPHRTEIALPTWAEPGESSGERESGLLLPREVCEGVRTGALGLHKGIGHPDERKAFVEARKQAFAVADWGTGCKRWPEHLHLLHEASGVLFPGRCRSTNLCDYCAKLAAVENTEMLWLDALEQGSPALWLLLTTNVAVWDGGAWKDGLEQVARACRRRWPEFEYACLIEFTTGYGERSGGQRRPHGNLFCRGVEADDQEELQQIAAAVWVPRMVEGWDRSPAYARAAFEQQRVYRVAEDKGGMRGLTRYVGLHFQKESQAPPKGWKGQRFRASRRYFVRPRTVMREEARASLRVKRRHWKAIQWAERIVGDRSVIPVELVEACEDVLSERDAAAAESGWQLIRSWRPARVKPREGAARQ